MLAFEEQSVATAKEAWDSIVQYNCFQLEFLEMNKWINDDDGQQ